MTYTAGEDMRAGYVVAYGSDPSRTLLLARTPDGWAGIATHDITLGDEITLGPVGSGADVVYHDSMMLQEGKTR